MITPQRGTQRHIFPMATFFSILGIAFSVWNILGDAELLCITEGCALFSDFNMGGLSLWWVGALGFTVLLIPALFGLGGWGKFLSSIGLLLDIFLLVIMLITVPCFNCLIIGLLMALTLFAFYAETRRFNDPMKISAILIVWLCVFIINAGNIFASLVGSWAILAPTYPSSAESLPADAPVQVYFSPSCSACQELVFSQEGNSSIAWYPVSENDEDIWRIAIMENRIKSGDSLTQAVRAATAPDALNNYNALDAFESRHLLLQFRVWRNTAHVMRSGTTRLPFVEYRGLPEGVRKTESRTENVPSAARTIPPAASSSVNGNSGNGNSGNDSRSAENVPPASSAVPPASVPALGTVSTTAPAPVSGPSSSSGSSGGSGSSGTAQQPAFSLGVAGFCNGGDAEPCQ